MLPLTLACSYCGDMIFSAEHWWAKTFPLVIFVLLLEAVGFAIVGRVKQRPAKLRRAFVVLPSLGLAVASGIIGFGFTFGVWVVLAIALVATAASIVANRADGAAITGGRALFVVTGVVAALVLQRPETRTTEELLRIAVYVSRFPGVDGWVFEELRGRTDAGPQLRQLLADPESGHGGNPVLVHARLGFPASERAAACERLRERKFTDERTAEVCAGK